MKIKYTLDKNNYEVLIKKDISSHIIKDLEKIGSDKKIPVSYTHLTLPTTPYV